MAGRKRTKKGEGKNPAKKKKNTDEPNEENVNVCYLEMLPELALIEILSYFDFREIVELSVLSKRLHNQITRLVKGFKYWSIYTDSTKKVPAFISKSKKDVSITLTENQTKNQLNLLCKLFNTRVVDISVEYSWIGRPYPKSVSTKLPRLERMNVECHESDSEISWIPGVMKSSCASLQYLRLVAVDLSMFDLTAKMTFSGLKKIVLSDCVEVPDIFFKLSAPQLETLVISAVWLPNKIKEISPAFKGLKTLVLRGNTGDTASLIKACAPTLKNLNISNVGISFLKKLNIEFPLLERIESQPRIEDADLDEPSGLEYLLDKCSKTLKTLVLSYDVFSLDFSRIKSSAFPALTKIDFTDNEEIKNFQLFLSKCPNLISFQQTGSTEQTEVYLDSTLEKYPELKTKELVHHSDTGVWYKLSDELSASIRTVQINLSRVDISGSGVKFLLDPRCEVVGVKYLTIRYIMDADDKIEEKQVHDQIIHLLNKSRSTLLHLHFEYCYLPLQLSQLQEFPQLQEVQFSHCRCLNTKLLDDVRQMFPRRSKLSVVKSGLQEWEAVCSDEDLIGEPYNRTVMKVDDL